MKKYLIIGIIFIILFLIISVYNHFIGLTSIDNFVYTLILKTYTPVTTMMMNGITFFGSRSFFVSVGIIVLWYPKVILKDKLAVLITVAIVATSSFLLKYLFLIERPDVYRLVEVTGYSFPSNHATASMALYTIITLLVLERIKNTKLRLLTKVLVTIPILVGVSRVYLGVHYFSDVIAGWSLAIGVAFIVYYISKAIKLKA